MPALLFGSISTLADTSEEQRAAFNEAFQEHGLDWKWEREEYRDLLTSNGGADRVADYAAGRGEEVDSAAVHRTKSEIFRRLLGSLSMRPRPGVVDTIRAAREQGWQVGFVTTTSPENVDAILGALGGSVSRDDFDVVVDTTDVEDPKPSPEAYRHALEQLGADAATTVAIEDNVGGARSAADAGITCLAFPNENTVEHDFGDATVTHRLDFAEVEQKVGRR